MIDNLLRIDTITVTLIIIKFSCFNHQAAWCFSSSYFRSSLPYSETARRSQPLPPAKSNRRFSLTVRKRTHPAGFGLRSGDMEP